MRAARAVLAWAMAGGRGVRRARVVGLGLLAVLVALHAGWGDGLDAPWRRLWFDALNAANPRARDAAPVVVVVAIDEAALAQYGQWPWPRSTVAALVERLRDAGALAIGVDILFVEPDRLSPRALAPWLGQFDGALAGSVAALPDTDAVLAATIAQGRVVLAVAGQPAGAAPSRNATDVAPAVVWDGPRPPGVEDFPQALQSLGVLQAGAEGFGAISFDGAPDGVVRRVGAVQRIAGRDHLMLAAETLRVANQGFFATVTPGPWGMGIDLGAQVLRAEADGRVWLHWGRLDPGRYVSAVDVLAGRAVLEGRIALVAVTGLGTVDVQQTPLGEAVYGIEAHAQLIEQMVAGEYLRRPAWVFGAEVAALVLAGLALVVLVPVAPPLLAVGAGLGLGGGLLGLSWGAHRAGLLVDGLGPALGAGLLGVALLAMTLVQRDRDRLRARIAYEAERADRQRLQGGIDAAAKIQSSLLPPRRFQRRGQVDLACHIAPALDIGGDFFDHFMIDRERLFFSVGDVSGKGVEASLFMALSKCLWKAAALRPGVGLGEIQVDANTGIGRDNAGAMFVTGVAGILELGTGRVWHSSAGHDQPFRFGTAAPRQLADHGGPVAGLDEDAVFGVGETVLAPGEWLCLFTDGVSEAMDRAGETYGLERLAARLAAAPGRDAPGLIAWILEDVRAFVGDAAPSDDLTLLVLGRPG